MSAPLVFVRDGRTLPYVPVTIAALEAIRAVTPRHRPYALATYLALLEFANEHRADRVALSQREIVERVGAGRTTVQAALGLLQEAGVLVVHERKHAGSRLENEYVVIEPDEEDDVARHTGDPPPASSARVARHTGEGRPPHGQQLQEGEEGEERERGSARARDPRHEVPPDFPDELRPHARHVMRVLIAVAEQHNAKEVSPLALGRVIMARPRKPLVKAAHDFAAWAADPPRPIKDVVASYRTWLDNPRTPTLAGIERLGDDGLPAEGPAAPPPGVTALRPRDQRDAERRERTARRRGAIDRVAGQGDGA